MLRDEIRVVDMLRKRSHLGRRGYTGHLILLVRFGYFAEIIHCLEGSKIETVEAAQEFVLSMGPMNQHVEVCERAQTDSGRTVHMYLLMQVDDVSIRNR